MFTVMRHDYEAREALILFVARGHYADRVFDLADLVLTAPLAQTAKPSAVRSQRLCLRPLNPTVPPIPHTAPVRVVELAVRGLKHQPDEESITLAHWFVVAKK
jgi:hypothetical protein